MRGIDEERVSQWLAANVEGSQPPFDFQLIAGGRSNLTYAVTDATGHRYVVRRPPLGHVLATAHDVAREYRIIAALGPTPVPVAPALAVCTDESVNGAPFYVMEFVDGEVLDSTERAALLPFEVRPAASRSLIDTLAALHAVDVDAVGLGDLARRDGYVERQLKRWSAQWAGSKTRELPAIDEVERELWARIPPQQGVVIAHGDYRFGNCLLDTATGAINAVLDWELCTLGDPLADLAYLAIYWTDPGEPPTRGNDPTAAGGFGPLADLYERYAATTGRDLTGIDYYVAFGSWRLAVISEGVYARYLHGAMGDSEAIDLDAMKAGTDALAAKALDAVHRLG